MTASGTLTYVEHGYRDSAGRVVAVPGGPRAEETARTLAEQFSSTYVRRIVMITRTRWSPS